MAPSSWGGILLSGISNDDLSWPHNAGEGDFYGGFQTTTLKCMKNTGVLFVISTTNASFVLSIKWYND